MTELERQLTRALRELSAQYEREQQRQAGLIEDLSGQVGQLAGQATRLAEGVVQDAIVLPGSRGGGMRRGAELPESGMLVGQRGCQGDRSV